MLKKITYIPLLLLLSTPTLAEVTQSTDTVLMVSPDTFQYNVETAGTNTFQKLPTNNDIKKEVMQEFKQMVAVLKKNKIRVIVIPSRRDVKTPDAVFPNNWLSVHKQNNRD